MLKAPKNSVSRKSQIYNFLEHPRGLVANGVQVFIVLLIFSSLATVGVDFFRPMFYVQHRFIFEVLNNVALAVFTIEYVAKLFSAPNRRKFIRRPTSIIDFLAIAPSYLEIILPLLVDFQGLRILRLLRLFRLLRILKLFRYGDFLKKVLTFHDTIFEKILPVMGILAAVKGLIWFMESRGWWFAHIDLTGLFTTIGFALGIILSQKIGASYDKFINIEEAMVRIYGNLQTLSFVFTKNAKKQNPIITNWTKFFLDLLKDEDGDNRTLHAQNALLYNAVYQLKQESAELVILCGDIVQDASFCLSKKTRLTPRPYDLLLQQATVMYLVLMAIFIPGFIGLISLLIASYVLYGMYELTVDIDSILGGSHNLISINLDELESLTEK